MTTALTFNSVTLSPVQHQGSLWIRAAELARALGYSRENSVSRLYRNNAEEFTPDMTQVIEISESTDSVLSTKTRIFSPRGCHLIAMFARTAVAKQFRRWVLDVLDKVCQPSGEPQAIPQNTTPSTAESRKPLRSLVHAWAQVTGVHHAALWPQVKAHFQLSRIDDLPDEWMPDALAFVQAKIDEAGRAPYSLPEPAAPAMPAPSIPADDRHFAVAAELKAIAQRLEQLCPDVARANYPRFCDRSEREQNRYEMQASLYRMGNASLRTAIASLTASWQVWEMMS